MITSLTEPSINKSVINRHSCLSHRMNRISKQNHIVPVKSPIKNSSKIYKKPTNIKETVKETVKPNPILNMHVKEEPQKTIEETPKQENIKKSVEPKTIEETPKQDDVMETAIKNAVNDTPVERKLEANQRSTYSAFNYVHNNRSHYSYNSILGTNILHN